MRLSDNQVSHFSNLLMHGAENKQLIRCQDRHQVLKATKEVFQSFLRAQDEVDALVRKKIASTKRSIPEGSREWDVLYRKYFEEEMQKRWR